MESACAAFPFAQGLQTQLHRSRRTQNKDVLLICAAMTEETVCVPMTSQSFTSIPLVVTGCNGGLEVIEILWLHSEGKNKL